MIKFYIIMALLAISFSDAVEWARGVSFNGWVTIICCTIMFFMFRDWLKR